ncbi:MAG: DUF6438 domain-containing protein [Saprospiraceae bacterium]
MKNKFTLLTLLLGCFLIISCSKKNKVVAAPPSSSYDIEVNSPAVEENVINEKSPKSISELSKNYRVVTMQKTGCYGKCPDYEFVLQSNGDAIYIGKKNVARLGRYTAHAKAGFIFSIKSEIKEGHFFKMSTVYPSNEKFIKDLPDTYLMVSDNINQIIIRNNHDAPTELIEFQNKIESMIEELEWVKK